MLNLEGKLTISFCYVNNVVVGALHGEARFRSRLDELNNSVSRTRYRQGHHH